MSANPENISLEQCFDTIVNEYLVPHTPQVTPWSLALRAAVLRPSGADDMHDAIQGSRHIVNIQGGPKWIQDEEVVATTDEELFFVAGAHIDDVTDRSHHYRKTQAPGTKRERIITNKYGIEYSDVVERYLKITFDMASEEFTAGHKWNRWFPDVDLIRRDIYMATLSPGYVEEPDAVHQNYTYTPLFRNGGDKTMQLAEATLRAKIMFSDAIKDSGGVKEYLKSIHGLRPKIIRDEEYFAQAPLAAISEAIDTVSQTIAFLAADSPENIDLTALARDFERKNLFERIALLMPMGVVAPFVTRGVVMENGGILHNESGYGLSRTFTDGLKNRAAERPAKLQAYNEDSLRRLAALNLTPDTGCPVTTYKQTAGKLTPIRYVTGLMIAGLEQSQKSIK